MRHPLRLTKQDNLCVVSILVDNEWVPLIIGNAETIDHTVEPIGIELTIQHHRSDKHPSRLRFVEKVGYIKPQCCSVAEANQGCGEWRNIPHEGLNKS